VPYDVRIMPYTVKIQKSHKGEPLRIFARGSWSGMEAEAPRFDPPILERLPIALLESLSDAKQAILDGKSGVTTNVTVGDDAYQINILARLAK
jgi:hypothetical protein